MHLFQFTAQVFIEGVWRISFLDFIFRRRYARIVFGKPIYANDFLGKDSENSNYYKNASREILKIVSGLSKVNK
jgi:hypothetical protein